MENLYKLDLTVREIDAIVRVMSGFVDNAEDDESVKIGQAVCTKASLLLNYANAKEYRDKAKQDYEIMYRYGVANFDVHQQGGESKC